MFASIENTQRSASERLRVLCAPISITCPFCGAKLPIARQPHTPHQQLDTLLEQIAQQHQCQPAQLLTGEVYESCHEECE